MRLLKPNWVSHDGRPIFSVDIHPDGSRFATGGQGDECGKVAIWNMGPIKSEEEELNDDIPKLLCTMDNHLACINCVRWSNNGKYLASGGDDNLVMIWQMTRYHGPMTTFGGGRGKLNIEQWRCVHNLRQHSGAGLVKGVTWDPVGKYLASQADDKTLRVWRTSDWQQETSVTEPFTECSGTTHVLRLSWSPDGHYVVSAHAMNNSGPVAKILERDGWKSRMDFVGHRKAITCVRFNPKLFVKKVNGDSTRLKQYSCCAIGCRDRSLSIWLTSLKRPLVVIHDLFNHSVMDLSWSQSGFELLVCSWDGTVAYADFSPEELGKAMSQQEKVSMSNSRSGFPSPNSASNLSINVREQQKETRTKDGRRRITPVLVAQMDVNDTPLPYGSSQTAPAPSAAPAAPAPALATTSASATDLTKIPTSQSLSALHSRIGEQSTTGFKESSKDIKITEKSTISFVKATTTTTKSTSSAVHSSPLKTTSVTHHPSPTKSNAASHHASPSKSVSASSTNSAAVTVSVKRKGDATVTGTAKRVRKDAKEQATKSSSTSSSRQREDHAHHDDSIATVSSVRHTVCIPSPAAEKSLTVQLAGSGTDIVTLELENNLGSSVNAVHIVKCVSAGKVSWEAMLTSPGIALAGNRNVVCVACANKSLNIFSFGGKRIMPILILDATASILQCSSNYVMTVTSSGGVYVWDSKLSTAVIKNESALAVLSGHDITIARTSITDKGHPVITLSNQCSYSFDPTVGTWIQLVRADDCLALNADYKANAPSQDPFDIRGPLAQLQGQSTRLAHQGGRMFRSNPGRQQTATVSHLENQLSACVALGSGTEYHFWLMTYVRYLVQAGLESRLREVCDEFLGPPYRSSLHSKISGWTPRILGYTKRELLAEILPIIGTNIRLQRLFTEYKDQLDAVEPR
ncbi:protein HIRA-like [Actinia tenebrosa]|uniref:Protein HIRA n=1 Tax=Actinia tenebrosa TaxID=6105 RepID=A0A6P8HLY7_ACTTE|nr:protein HIRA-like [Actinia tenebrosa]